METFNLHQLIGQLTSRQLQCEKNEFINVIQDILSPPYKKYVAFVLFFISIPTFVD